MADIEVGSIVYTVEADAGKLLISANDVDKVLDKNQKSFDKTDKSASKYGTEMTKTAKAVNEATKEMSNQTSVMSGLTKVFISYLSLRTLQSLIAMSDQYGQMASRIRNATRSTEEYEMVQARLLDTANGTYRSLAEAQEVYLSTADILRDLGYNTSEVLDITDSLSYAFVRDAARADQARTAMDAYSKALMKGKIEGDAWASLLAATPSLVKSIADATGASEEQVRKLGATGKLSTDALNEGLRQSREESKRLADEMEVAVADAFTKLRNAMTVFIGKVNESSKASGVLTSNIAELADVLQDPETIKAAQELAAGVVTALTTIITATKDVVGAVKWMAESLAARIHGAAIDDAVRFGEQLDRNVKRLKDLRAQREIAAKGGSSDLVTANLDKQIEQLDQAVKGQQALIDMRDKAAAQAKQENKEEPKQEPKKNRKVQLIREEEEGTKKLTEAQKAQKKAADEQARGEEQNRETIDKMVQSLLEAALTGEELAAAKAKASLNKFATQEEIDLMDELGRALAQANAQADIRKKYAEDAKGTIRGDVDPLKGGQFDDQFARYAAEETAENERYAKQLERLNQAKAAQVEVVGGYYALEEQTAREHADRIGQIEDAKNQLMLKTAENGFGAVADVLRESVGEQSAIYKAAFAASKAFAIAQAIISIQQGIAQAAANPFPANLAAMASVASATAGLVSSISSVTMGGGRQYGGPVHAGAMHRVNENGQPEVLNMANGRQYLLPGSSGGNVQPLGGVNGAQTSTSAGGNTTIHVSVKIDAAGGESVQATATPGYEKFARDVGALIDERFKEHEMNSYKQGGMSWDAMNGRIR